MLLFPFFLHQHPPSLHDQDIPEPRLASFQGLNRLCDIAECILLNHALHAVRQCKLNRLLAVQRMAARPALHAGALRDQRHGVDIYVADGRETENLAVRGEALRQSADHFGIGRRLDDDGGAAELGQFGIGIGVGGVDVVVRAELRGKGSLVVAVGEHRDLVAHLASELHGQVAQAAEPLDGDEAALLDSLLADAVEDGDARTQQRRRLCGLHLLGDAHDGLSTQQHVLGKAAVLRDAVDGLVLAVLELTALALPAHAVVPAVPRPAHALADGEVLDVGAELDNVTDDFVARRAREDVAKVAFADLHVRPADAAGEDLDEDLVGGRVLQGHILEGEGGVGCREDDGFVGFGERGCHFARSDWFETTCVISLFALTFVLKMLTGCIVNTQFRQSVESSVEAFYKMEELWKSFERRTSLGLSPIENFES